MHGAFFSAQMARDRDMPPLDPDYPFTGSYLILVSAALADALGNVNLGKRLREFDTFAFTIIGEELMALDANRSLMRRKGRQQVGKKLPARGHFQLIIRNEYNLFANKQPLMTAANRKTLIWVGLRSR